MTQSSSKQLPASSSLASRLGTLEAAVARIDEVLCRLAGSGLPADPSQSPGTAGELKSIYCKLGVRSQMQLYRLCPGIHPSLRSHRDEPV